MTVINDNGSIKEVVKIYVINGSNCQEKTAKPPSLVHLAWHSVSVINFLSWLIGECALLGAALFGPAKSFNGCTTIKEKIVDCWNFWQVPTEAWLFPRSCRRPYENWSSDGTSKSSICYISHRSLAKVIEEAIRVFVFPVVRYKDLAAPNNVLPNHAHSPSDHEIEIDNAGRHLLGLKGAPLDQYCVGDTKEHQLWN